MKALATISTFCAVELLMINHISIPWNDSMTFVAGLVTCGLVYLAELADRKAKEKNEGSTR
jgi:hypothetical protein